MANTYSAGVVTAYGAYVRGGGTLSYDEWCALQARMGEVEQEIADAADAINQTVETFTETTVPEAVQSVTDEGTTQIGLVEDKGEEVISSIPSDYTALDAKVTSLNQKINHFDDNLPGTVQTVNFGTDGKPSSVVHTKNGATVRTDAYTWGDGTVTETRTTADGSYITMVTDLTTLVTTISEIQEAS